MLPDWENKSTRFYTISRTSMKINLCLSLSRLKSGSWLLLIRTANFMNNVQAIYLKCMTNWDWFIELDLPSYSLSYWRYQGNLTQDTIGHWP